MVFGSRMGTPGDSSVDPQEADTQFPCNFEPRIVLIVGLLAAFLCLTFFVLLYAHNCKRLARSLLNRRGGVTGPANGSSAASTTYLSIFSGGPSTPGVQQRVIDSLPSFVLRNLDLKQGMVMAECPVCLSRYEERDALRMLPRCGHAFHTLCIDKWLATKTSCPLCRSPVSSEDVLSMPTVSLVSTIFATVEGVDVIAGASTGTKFSENPALPQVPTSEAGSTSLTNFK